VSDRASTGVYDDESGPAILQFFAEAVRSPWRAEYRLVPDEQPQIEAAIKELVGGPFVHCTALH
jgi:molybdopterin adenylyltransferase